MIFKGLWINREGKARAWNFRTSVGRTETIAVTLMVLEPVCQSPNYFMPPGILTFFFFQLFSLSANLH